MTLSCSEYETPFENAEAAWFYFINCEKMKADGGKPISNISIIRPCSPTDIYNVVIRLRQLEQLTSFHIMVLTTFGKYGYRPDPNIYGGRSAYAFKKRGECGRDERRAAKAWDEAMEIIEPELRKKGIIQ